MTDNANFIKQRIQQIAELGECEIADRWCDGCGECKENHENNKTALPKKGSL